jgi:hypothetical protein
MAAAGEAAALGEDRVGGYTLSSAPVAPPGSEG